MCHVTLKAWCNLSTVSGYKESKSKNYNRNMIAALRPVYHITYNVAKLALQP
jgi:hypothetical protein